MRRFGRNLLFAGTVALICVALLEVGAYAVYYTAHGEWLPREAIQDELRRETTAGDDAGTRQTPERRRYPNWMRHHILHPYLGFVRDPEWRVRFLNGERVNTRVNRYGFFGPPPLADDAPDRLTIALTGGSVAAEVFAHSRSTLRETLARELGRSEESVRVVSLAVEGFKQPQQLMAVNYVLSIGGRIDVVINLDGFNEVVLPVAENFKLGVAPYYPRAWSVYASKGLSPENAMLAAQGARLSYRRDRARHIAARAPWIHSAFVLAAWDVFDDWTTGRLRSLEKRMQANLAERQETLTPQESGPPYRAGDRATVLSDAAAVWERASLQLYHLCRASDIAYFHFLQPNQYVGPKELTSRERRRAYAGPDSAYRVNAEQGYPRLRERGERLAERGVAFFDLTGMFADESGTVYRDQCCHLNGHGNDTLAARMAERVGSALDRSVP